jgi:type IX secretion system PorP/SprF family membrane protein
MPNIIQKLSLVKLFWYLFYFFLTMSPKDIFGQLTSGKTTYYTYEQVQNPASTGRDRYPFINLSSKKYWLNTPNSPYEICLGGTFRLGQFNFYKPNMMLNKANFVSRDRMGLGGFLMYDQDGPMGYLFGEFEYAYHLPLNTNRTTELSFGLSLNISDYNINKSLLDPIDNNDPLLTNVEKQAPALDGGFGIYFNTSQLFAGGSIKDILASELYKEDTVKNKRDYFINGGYKFFLHFFDLEPSIVMALIDDNPFYSGQVKVYYKDNNWLSLGYMSSNIFRFAVGFRVQRIHIVYALEQSVSRMAKYFPNSHEIILGINIGLFEPGRLKKTVKRL